MSNIIIWKPGDPLPPLEILDWITEDIALGSIDQAMASEVLDTEGVKAIVSIGELAPKTRLFHKHFPHIKDDHSFLNLSDGQISEVLTAIAEARRHGKVFVHCAAGVSRSPGFTALYLSMANDIGFPAAFEIVKERRKKANPIPVVLMRLNEYRRNHSSPTKRV